MKRFICLSFAVLMPFLAGVNSAWGDSITTINGTYINCTYDNTTNDCYLVLNGLSGTTLSSEGTQASCTKLCELLNQTINCANANGGVTPPSIPISK
jgi:hypothetical protein